MLSSNTEKCFVRGKYYWVGDGVCLSLIFFLLNLSLKRKKATYQDPFWIYCDIEIFWLGIFALIQISNLNWVRKAAKNQFQILCSNVVRLTATHNWPTFGKQVFMTSLHLERVIKRHLKLPVGFFLWEKNVIFNVPEKLFERDYIWYVELNAFDITCVERTMKRGWIWDLVNKIEAICSLQIWGGMARNHRKLPLLVNECCELSICCPSRKKGGKNIQLMEKLWTCARWTART